MNQIIKMLGGAAVQELQQLVAGAVADHYSKVLQDGGARVNFAHGGQWDGYRFDVDPSRVNAMWQLLGSSNLMAVVFSGTPKSTSGNPLSVVPRMSAVFALSPIYGNKAYMSSAVGWHGEYGSDSSGGYFNPAWDGTIGFGIDLSAPEAFVNVGWINAGSSGRTWAQLGPGLVAEGETQDDIGVEIFFIGP